MGGGQGQGSWWCEQRTVAKRLCLGVVAAAKGLGGSVIPYFTTPSAAVTRALKPSLSALSSANA